MPLETKDCFGQTVCVGDRVKVIGFSDAFMKSLLPEDHAHISRMVGDVFVVEEAAYARDRPEWPAAQQSPAFPFTVR